MSSTARRRCPSPKPTRAADPWGAGDAPSLIDRCRALGLVLTSDPVVSHDTAAALWGMPCWGPLVADVHVTREPSASAIRRSGVVNHRADLPAEHRGSVRGVVVTSPARQLLDLASVLPLDRLVATGDHCLRALDVGGPEVDQIISWARGRVGAAGSPPCGLPAFEPNAEIFDGGEFVARVDLLEGAYHRTREQYASDIGRRARLTALGFEVVQIEATMMGSPRGVVLHVAQRLVGRGWTGTPETAALARLRHRQTTA